MARLDTELLSELIDRKLDCLQQLRGLGGRQLELAREGSVNDVLDVLSVKQRLLDDLYRLERALDPFREQDPEARRWPTADARQRCAQRAATCDLLLGQIMAQEKESEQELVRRRDETAVQLQGIGRAQRAREAYAEPAGDACGQLNFTSER